MRYRISAKKGPTAPWAEDGQHFRWEPGAGLCAKQAGERHIMHPYQGAGGGKGLPPQSLQIATWRGYPPQSTT